MRIVEIDMAKWTKHLREMQHKVAHRRHLATRLLNVVESTGAFYHYSTLINKYQWLYFEEA